MKTKRIDGYGKVSIYSYLNRTLNKYRCRWIKTIAGRRFYCGTKNIIAPTIDIAIKKASAIKGYKPNLIQRI
jgi:hypothetical protein